ncbi:unnamed protein product [Spodoptera exigua]|nr:unnamed protein product [Spodoptera exigua]
MVTATVYCAPAPLRYLALAVYSLGSLLGLYKAMRAWSPWERRLCFAAPFCMRVLLAGARAARLGGGDPHAILHVFLQGLSLRGGVPPHDSLDLAESGAEKQGRRSLCTHPANE